MAAIALTRKDQTRAIAELQAQVDVDFDNVAAARDLAALMRQANVTDPARLMPVYARIVAIDPFDIDAHTAFGRAALQRNEFDTASREFRAVLALAPVDRASALTDLAESYSKAGKRADARTQILAALEIAPTYERAQSLLLTIVNAN
jgi:Flp pilus assembly protein TadD